MKKLLLLIVPFLLLVGCGNTTSDESADKVKSDSDVTENNDDTAIDKEDVKTTSEVAENDDSKVKSAEVENEKPEDETVAKTPVETTEPKEVENNKKKYMKKLATVEKAVAQIDPGSQNSQTEMNIAQKKALTKWDDALNEIYGALEEQLPTEKMNKLREKQRAWIKMRDETAKKEASKFKGGTLYSFEYGATAMRLTKERCYELVENYMGQN